MKGSSARTAAPTIGRRSWCRPPGHPTVITLSCPSRALPIPARSSCSCITAMAAPAYASAPLHRRSPRRVPMVPRPRRPRTGWARSYRRMADSSTTRSAPAPSLTTRGSRSGRSIVTTPRPVTSRRSPTPRAARFARSFLRMASRWCSAPVTRRERGFVSGISRPAPSDGWRTR